MFQSLSREEVWKKKFRLEKGFKSYDFFSTISLFLARHVILRHNEIFTFKNNLISRRRYYPSSEKKISHGTNIFRLWYRRVSSAILFVCPSKIEGRRTPRLNDGITGWLSIKHSFYSVIRWLFHLHPRTLINSTIHRGTPRKNNKRSPPLARARPPPQPTSNDLFSPGKSEKSVPVPLYNTRESWLELTRIFTEQKTHRPNERRTETKIWKKGGEVGKGEEEEEEGKRTRSFSVERKRGRGGWRKRAKREEKIKCSRVE